MPWPFKRKMSEMEYAVATQIIRHIQNQFAFFQLATEVYNDALVMASGNSNPSGNILAQDIFALADTQSVRQFLIPGITQKIDIIRKMEDEHEDFCNSQESVNNFDVLNKWTLFLAIYQSKARLHLECYNEYVEDYSMNLTVRITSLDESEGVAVTDAVEPLQTLIKKVGLEGDPLRAINCAAINNVRNTIGLRILEDHEFHELLSKATTGESVSFFK